MPRVFAILGVLVAPLWSTYARAEDLRLKLQLEVRSEVDTNPHRTESAKDRFQPMPAGAGSTVARLALGWRPAPAQSLRMNLVGSGRRYVGTSDTVSLENMAQVAGDLRYDAWVSPYHLAGVRASYYEAYQQGFEPALSRDFRTGDLTILLTLRRTVDQQASARAGYRLFRHKPNADLDFQGEHVGLAYRQSFESEQDGEAPTTDLLVEYTLEHREFGGLALAPPCPEGVAPSSCATSSGRSDLLHNVALEWTYASEQIYSARYDLFLNDSTSLGLSQRRHRLAVSATALAGWGIFMTATLVAHLSQSVNAAALQALTIADEAHNALILHATRDLSEDFSLEARYAFYAYGWTGTELDYSRQSAYVGAVYSFTR